MRFVLRRSIRVTRVDYERHAPLSKTIAQRDRGVSPELEADDCNGEPRLLSEPERIAERQRAAYQGARRFQRSRNFHRDKRLVLRDENTAARKIGTHDTTSANDGGLHGC